jgi:hypothetical protein
MILSRWPAVCEEARKHETLQMLAQVTRPQGRTVGYLLTIDPSLSEMIFHTIVGIPEKIVRELRAVYAAGKATTAAPFIESKTKGGVEPVCLSGNKREREDEDGVLSSLPRAEGGVQESVGFGANKQASTPPLCAASSSVSGATTTCAARCESCKQGCGCSAWDTTNHAIIDGAKICCYDCYKVMCDEKATPVSVQHLNEGMPFIISRKATGDLDTDRARLLCEKMVAAMRQLEKRRHHELQYGVTGDCIQIREARKHVSTSGRK